MAQRPTGGFVLLNCQHALRPLISQNPAQTTSRNGSRIEASVPEAARASLAASFSLKARR